MKTILFLLAFASPIILVSQRSYQEAQHTFAEAKEIAGVFHLAEMINDNGLAFFNNQLAEDSEMSRWHTNVPTKGIFARNHTGKLYAAQIIEILQSIYDLELFYRGGHSIWSALFDETGLNDSNKLTEAQRMEIDSTWSAQMLEHPGYLIELALGENILDTVQMQSKRSGSYFSGGWRVDWTNYQYLVSTTRSVYDQTTPELLELLFNLKLVTPEIYQHWKADMETNGYFTPAYLLRELAKEMGEQETRPQRSQNNQELLEQLYKVGLMTEANKEQIVADSVLLGSSEYGAYLPYLTNIQRIDFPMKGTMAEGYPMILSALSALDTTLSAITFKLEQVDRPADQPATGEYFQVTFSGLGQESSTIIHAHEDSGDTPGQPPRLLFIPTYLKVIDDLLEKANYPQRLFTAELWGQVDSEDAPIPVYLLLADKTQQPVIDQHYFQLQLSGND